MSEPAGVLDDIKVLEIASIVAIPVCGLLLADMGAEVIKVEPRAGEPFRVTSGPIFPGESKGYTLFNRGKRAFCLDLSHPRAAEVVDRLVAASDVVLVSLKLSDVPRYGLEYERLSEVRPGLVYLEHAPLGPEGPNADDGGYDVVVQGRSGVAAITGRSLGPAPAWVRPAYNDMATGFLSALAVVAALRHRDRTGEGQKVTTSLLSTAVALGGPMLHWFAATDPPVWERLEEDLARLRADGAGFESQRSLLFDRLQPGARHNIYFRHYRTADGFISVGCLSPALFARFRAVTGVDDPRSRPGWDPEAGGAGAELDAMVARAEALLAEHSSAWWLGRLREGGVPSGPFNFPHEAFRDPQINANDYLPEIEHPVLGTYRSFATPFRMAKTPPRIRKSSPLYDADTDAILAEAGFSPDEVAALRSEGVVGGSGPQEQVW
ncbi:MAG: CaiB/BaiF CoA transferase family protein [Dehalococcoidia bacterium]